MSIIGIDLGNMYTKAAFLEKGVVETILFNNSSRLNYTYLTIKDKRFIGSNSFNIYKNNLDRTTHSFYKLIHNIFNGQMDQNIENKYQDDELFIPIKNIDGKEFYLHYLFLSYIELVIKSLNINLDDTYILSIPSYFNITEKKFIEDSLNIIDLKYRLLSEEYAISLDYGFYKSYKKQFEKPKNVLFVNIGDSNTNVFITNFDNNGLTILKQSYSTIGSYEITERLYDHFNRLIFKKHSINVSDYPKKKIILMRECEKAKKILSTNQKASINIDCLFEDICINESINKETFESLIDNIYLEILDTVNYCMDNFEINDIDSVELLGGGMRTTKIKEIISERFNKKLNFTLNPEDSIAKGCVLFGAINSPLIKNANYTINKILNDPISMKVSHLKDLTTVFENKIKLPYENKITFNVIDNFELEFLSKHSYIISKYKIEILDNKDSEKIKLDLYLEINFDNEVNIKNYKIKSKKDNIKLNIINLYHCKLSDNEINEIKNLRNDILSNEIKIDNFYNIVNQLEEIYYNSSNIEFDYLNPDEINELNDKLSNINKKIIEEDPDIADINFYFQINNEINHFFQLINSKKESFSKLDLFKKEIENKITKLDLELELDKDNFNKFKNYFYNKIKEIEDNKYKIDNIKSEIINEISNLGIISNST